MFIENLHTRSTDNVWSSRIPTANHKVGQATPQNPTEDNVAYYQATSQISTEDKLIMWLMVITMEDNVRYYDYAAI